MNQLDTPSPSMSLILQFR